QKGEHDTDRDRAARGALQGQVHEVVGREEARVEQLEDAPDDREADDDGDRAEVARETDANVVDEGGDAGTHGGGLCRLGHEVGPIRRGAGYTGAGLGRACSVAPVIAAMMSS